MKTEKQRKASAHYMATAKGEACRFARSTFLGRIDDLERTDPDGRKVLNVGTFDNLGDATRNEKAEAVAVDEIEAAGATHAIGKYSPKPGDTKQRKWRAIRRFISLAESAGAVPVVIVGGNVSDDAMQAMWNALRTSSRRGKK